MTSILPVVFPCLFIYARMNVTMSCSASRDGYCLCTTLSKIQMHYYKPVKRSTKYEKLCLAHASSSPHTSLVKFHIRWSRLEIWIIILPENTHQYSAWNFGISVTHMKAAQIGIENFRWILYSHEKGHIWRKRYLVHVCLHCECSWRYFYLSNMFCKVFTHCSLTKDMLQCLIWHPVI